MKQFNLVQCNNCKRFNLEHCDSTCDGLISGPFWDNEMIILFCVCSGCSVFIFSLCFLQFFTQV